jgi:anaerobic selenocysteine-containing dehydrogenase
MRRRDFLKASALAAGVSLLEACGTAEEQFLVQPVRRSSSDPLPGESVWRSSVCSQCGAGCGLQVRIVDGNAKKLEGTPRHPVNGGGVCALGHSLLQEIYNPDRILAPQRRAGDRGDGSFAPVSWEEALAEAGGAIAAAAPHRIAFVCGGVPGDLTLALWRRLAAALGAPAPAVVEPAGLAVERQAARDVLGIAGLPYFDIGRADFVLSIGAPFLDRWHNPVHYTAKFAAMRRARGGRLAHAEPRMSLTAAAADQWLPVRPGTEGVLARTLAGVLLSEDLIDPDDAARYRVLFPQPAPALEEGAAICDVAADKIHRAAVELAAAARRVVLAGGSAAASSNGLFNVRAGLALNLLLGTLGEPGGVFAPASLELDGRVAPAATPLTSLADLAARLRGETGDPVEVLVVAETDPLHTLPGTWGLREALRQVDEIVVLSSFLHDTALQADLLLPLNTELERFQATQPAPLGIPALSLAEPAIEPLGDGRHPADIALAVAAALGEPVAGELPWPSFTRLVEGLIESERQRLPGGADTTTRAFIDAALERGGIFGDGPPREAPPGPSAGEAVASSPSGATTGAGGTAGTTFGAATTTGPTEGTAPMPEAVFDGEPGAYPFVLVPFVSVKTDEGRGANRPWLQELPDPLSTVMWDSWLEISPPDAAALGVRDGDRLRVVSTSGEIEVRGLIDPTVRPGLVGIPVGQGHDDYGRYAADRGANPMRLLSRRLVDGATAPAWCSSRVRLERLGPGELPRFGRRYDGAGEGESIPVGWAPMAAPEEKRG